MWSHIGSWKYALVAWWNLGEPSVHTTLCKDTNKKSLKHLQTFGHRAFHSTCLHRLIWDWMSTTKSCFKEIDQSGHLFNMETPKKHAATIAEYTQLCSLCWLHIQLSRKMGRIRIYLRDAIHFGIVRVSMGLQRDFAHWRSTITWIAPPADGASRNTALTCKDQPAGRMKW